MKKMLKVNMLRLLLGMSTLVFFCISGSFTAYAGDTPAAPQQHKRVVKGRVTDKKTGEPIVGATVWFKESTSGTATDIKARKWYCEKKMGLISSWKKPVK